MNSFCCPHRVSAARADIFPATGSPGRHDGGSYTTVRACAGYGDAIEFISANQDICQPVLQNEVQQIIAGGGDCPSIFWMQFYDQSVRLGGCFELLVVIGVVPAGILDLMLIAV